MFTSTITYPKTTALDAYVTDILDEYATLADAVMDSLRSPWEEDTNTWTVTIRDDQGVPVATLMVSLRTGDVSGNIAVLYPSETGATVELYFVEYNLDGNGEYRDTTINRLDSATAR